MLRLRSEYSLDPDLGAGLLTGPSAPRDNAVNCSIGIGRFSGTTLWDITVYNVPQPLRQDVNIVTTLKNVPMAEGESITVSKDVPQAITITNVDNKPVFDYDIPELKAPIADPNNGKTQVQLKFEIKDAGLSWTSDNCGAGNVIYSAGIESWSCDFACPQTSTKEL